MKKQIVIVVIIILLIIIIGLSGCNEQKSGKDKSEDIKKFIGTWNGGHWNTSVEEKDETWIFYENSSVKMIDNLLSEEWATYEIDESGEFCIRRPEIHFLMCYTYQFSDNDNYLTLSLAETTAYMFAKAI